MEDTPQQRWIAHLRSRYWRLVFASTQTKEGERAQAALHWRIYDPRTPEQRRKHEIDRIYRKIDGLLNAETRIGEQFLAVCRETPDDAPAAALRFVAILRRIHEVVRQYKADIAALRS